MKKLRDIFNNEATEFTPWLMDHIDNIFKQDIGFNSITIQETKCQSENLRVDMIGYVNNIEEQTLIKFLLQKMMSEYV